MGTTTRPVKWLKGLALGRIRARADPLHCEVMPEPRNWDSPDAATAARTELGRSRWVRQLFYLLGRRSETHTGMLLQLRKQFNGDVFATGMEKFSCCQINEDATDLAREATVQDCVRARRTKRTMQL